MNKILRDDLIDEVKIAYLDDKINILKNKGYEVSFEYYFSKRNGIQIMLSKTKGNVTQRERAIFLPFKKFELKSLCTQLYVFEAYHFGKMKMLMKNENGSVDEIDVQFKELCNIISKKYDNIKNNEDCIEENDVYKNRNYISLKYEPKND